MDSEFSRKKALVLGALSLVFLAIPVTVYTALQQQETRSRAADPTGIVSIAPSVAPAPTSIPDAKKCFQCTLYPDVGAVSAWVYNSDNTVTIRSTISKSFTDNTYGINSIGWSPVRGHRFGDLVGSDKLNMALYDKADTKIMEFAVDYLEVSSDAPSGYKSLCVTGGDGEMILGNASYVVSCKTSLDENLNTFGYRLVTDSPATDNNYSLNSEYPNWIYEVWYEVTVRTEPFAPGGGIKEPIIAEIHSSPSKKTEDICPVIETECSLDTITALAPTPVIATSISQGPTPVCTIPERVQNVKINCPNCDDFSVTPTPDLTN